MAKRIARIPVGLRSPGDLSLPSASQPLRRRRASVERCGSGGYFIFFISDSTCLKPAGMSNSDGSAVVANAEYSVCISSNAAGLLLLLLARPAGCSGGLALLPAEPAKPAAECAAQYASSRGFLRLGLLRGSLRAVGRWRRHAFRSHRNHLENRARPSVSKLP